MRKFINIISEALSEPEEKLIDALHDWMSDYNEADAYDNSKDAECDRIIALAKDFPVTYRGVLYRGTAIMDEYAKAIERGETVTVPPLPKKLVSWTKDVHIADLFADNAVSSNHSAVIIAMDVSQLRTVVDFDILYDNRPETGHESEVLAYNTPLVLSRRNVKHLWVYDPEAEESVQIF